MLREENCSLPHPLKAIVNNRGSVTLIVVDTSGPATSYAPYFEALTTKLNQLFPVESNPWLPFRLAPTPVQLAIDSLPVDYMPLQDEDLSSYLSDSILNSTGVTISAARFLNPNRQSHMEKYAYSVVVNVEPDSVQTMLPSIYLFGNTQTVEKPTRPPPLPSARSSGSTAMSNHYARRRPQHALCAPSSTRKRSTAAPIHHAPVGETSNLFSTAAWPPRPDAPTVEKCTQPEAETAVNAPLESTLAQSPPPKKTHLS